MWKLSTAQLFASCTHSELHCSWLHGRDVTGKQVATGLRCPWLMLLSAFCCVHSGDRI